MPPLGVPVGCPPGLASIGTLPVDAEVEAAARDLRRRYLALVAAALGATVAYTDGSVFGGDDAFLARAGWSTALVDHGWPSCRPCFGWRRAPRERSLSSPTASTSIRAALIATLRGAAAGALLEGPNGDFRRHLEACLPRVRWVPPHLKAPGDGVLPEDLLCNRAADAAAKSAAMAARLPPETRAAFAGVGVLALRP